MGSLSTRWLLAMGLAVCLLPGPALLAEDKEEKKEEKKVETEAAEKQDQQSKSKKEKTEKKKEKKGGRGLLARPTSKKPAQPQTAPQTQTAPSAAQTQPAAMPESPPGTRVFKGFVQQIRKEARALIIRDNLIHHQVFVGPETPIRRGREKITFEQIERMDQVVECRVNSKNRVLELRLNPARRMYAPMEVPKPPPPANKPTPPSPPKDDD